MLATAEEEVGLRALCTSEELGESLIRRRQELDLLELMWSRDAGRFAATKEYERDGFNSPYDWMRVNCHMNSGQVLDRIAVGEQVNEMPDSVQALIAARLDTLPPALREIARARRAHPDLNLSELARRLKLSKSAVNHRLRRLMEIAETPPNGDRAHAPADAGGQSA